MQPDDNEPMISGDVQNTQFVQTGMNPQPQTIMIDPMTGLPQNVIIMQQPSSAPQVVGILVIIYGAISFLGSALGVFGSSLLASEVDDSLLNEYATQLIVFSLASVFVSIAIIISGVWINNRQTKGVHLAFAAIGVGLLLSILQQMIIPAELSDPSGVGQAIGIGMSVVCNGICGLIVAIPLMVSGSGMDDSKLF
tara:strand:+ start:366 stop:950 length:585 start_codon:yes stop_codon:yes gene_type:complete